MVEKSVAELPDWTMTTGLSREEQFLMHCARINLSPARREALRDLLAAGLDWDLLLERATWHRLSCLVSSHLRTADLSPLVPQPVLQKLKLLYRMSLARNMLLQDALSQLLSALNREEIPVIVLKGAALLGSVYQDISLRPMTDLDILVQPQHLDRTEAIALCQGYVQVANRDTHDEARVNWHHLPYLVHQKRRTVLEIHQHIVDVDEPYRFDLSGFWARARPMLGASALTLAPEDLLIHLSIQFLLDRRYLSSSALGQLCDISEVVLHYGDSLNWNLIEKVANEYGIAPGLYCALYACEQLLSTQVPASVLSRLHPSKFNPSMPMLFIRRRVLDTKLWLAHDLVSSHLPYSRHRALRAIIERFFRIPENISQEPGSRRHLISVYFKRMRDTFPRLGRVLLRPTELKQDLLLDRWLHDICSSGVRTSRQETP